MVLSAHYSILLYDSIVIPSGQLRGAFELIDGIYPKSSASVSKPGSRRSLSPLPAARARTPNLVHEYCAALCCTSAATISNDGKVACGILDEPCRAVHTRATLATRIMRRFVCKCVTAKATRRRQRND